MNHNISNNPLPFQRKNSLIQAQTTLIEAKHKKEGQMNRHKSGIDFSELPENP